MPLVQLPPFNPWPRRATFRSVPRVSEFFALLAVAVLISGLLPVAHGAEQSKGYVYAAVDSSSNIALVIDVASHLVYLQNKLTARVGSTDGSGGYYRDCGNATFYCLTGVLEMVVPKAMPMTQWTYHDLFCQSVATADRDTYRITCQSSKFRGRPTYTYSLTRGIVSIENNPAGGEQRYVLRGERGMFAPESHP